MKHIFRWLDYIVTYDNGDIDIVDLEGYNMGSYTMGATMIVGSTLIASDIRKDIKEYIDQLNSNTFNFI